MFANKALRKKAVEEMQQTHHVINEAQCLRDMVRSTNALLTFRVMPHDSALPLVLKPVPLAQSHTCAVPLAPSRSAQSHLHRPTCTAACMRAVALIQSHYHRLWLALSQDHSNILRLILTHKDPTYLYMLLELVQASQASVPLRCTLWHSRLRRL